MVLSGLGVFAKEFIPRGLKVGPYQGSVVFKEDMENIEDTSYMWEVHACTIGCMLPTCLLYACTPSVYTSIVSSDF